MNRENHILVVDDEEDIRELVQYNLVREGYSVECAASGEDALNMVRKNIPDLIILDLMLPGIDGLTVSRELKKNPTTDAIPIVMLTAKGEETDIIVGLELGADDYITKPFSPKVLIARIKAVLRRKEVPSQESKPEDTEDMIHIHELSIHPGRHEVLINGRAIELTFTEFQVLYYLVSRPGWVSTRTQIVDAVRGEGYAVTDRSVDVQIVGLRKKLGPCADYIQTVRGVGYRFKEK